MQQKTAVVILNWNGREFLEKFLGDVVKHSSPAARVVVADNGSTDDSLEWITANCPEVEVVRLDVNYGFAGGYNRALKAVDAQYYMLLNSDVEVGENWLEPLVRLMDSDAQIAACQPKILSYAHPRYFEYAGAAGGYIDAIGYPFCRGRLIGECEHDEGQYDDEREIFWATGAAMMVRASEFHAYGGFDDTFFAHQEEIDLCWRFKRGGMKIFACPASAVWHVGAGTLPVWSPMKTYLNFRNNIAMLYKNLSVCRFAAVYFVRFFTDTLRVATYILQPKFAGAIIRGHRDFWRMRRKFDRHNELPHGRVGQIYRGSIVLFYLFVGKSFSKIKQFFT